MPRTPRQPPKRAAARPSPNAARPEQRRRLVRGSKESNNANLATWGNELYTGKRSYDFVGKYKLWFSIAGVLVLLSIVSRSSRAASTWASISAAVPSSPSPTFRTPTPAPAKAVVTIAVAGPTTRA